MRRKLPLLRRVQAITSEAKLELITLERTGRGSIRVLVDSASGYHVIRCEVDETPQDINVIDTALCNQLREKTRSYQ